MKQKIKTFSLFSGVGGFELGLDDRFEVIGFSEIDPYASGIYEFQFAGADNYGDITKIRIEELPDFDLLIGGSPCQSFSIGGKRTGLSGQSGLFYYFLKTLQLKQPRYFVWENVAGTLSSTDGWDFAYVQMGMDKAGYNIRWELLNSKHFGIPQDRERIFIVGFLRGCDGPPILFDPRISENLAAEKQGIRFLF